MPKCMLCDQVVPAGVQQCPQCKGPISPATADQQNDVTQQVRLLLSQNQKLAAIKLYREQTGASLLDAKNAVEALEPNQPVEVPDGVSPELEMEVVQLLGQGRKLEAVKLYRNRTGIGLRDSRVVVEAVARRYGLQAGSSLPVLTLLFLGIAVLVGVGLLLLIVVR